MAGRPGRAVRSWAHLCFSSVCHRRADDHSKQRVLQSCTSSLACERTSDRIGSVIARLRPLASTEGVREETQHLQGSTELTSERAFQLLCEPAPKLPAIISVPRLRRDESRGDSPATGDFDPPRLHRALWVLAPRHPRPVPNGVRAQIVRRSGSKHISICQSGQFTGACGGRCVGPRSLPHGNGHKYHRPCSNG